MESNCSYGGHVDPFQCCTLEMVYLKLAMNSGHADLEGLDCRLVLACPMVLAPKSEDPVDNLLDNTGTGLAHSELDTKGPQANLHGRVSLHEYWLPEFESASLGLLLGLTVDPALY